MTDQHAKRIVAAFVERYLDDLDHGEPRSCDEYQALFPGYDDLIRETWSQLAESGPSSDRERLGPWLLEEELARGGQARIYKASHQESAEIAAVKVFFGELTGQEQKRFEREAAVVARLRHPSICRILEAGEDGGRSYIAMELIEGESLAKRLARSEGVPGRTEILTHVARIEEIARALHEAHEVGVVHRDVKAANIMVPATGSPVLVDFGLASDEQATQAMTMTGDFFGTPDYMSPEQLTKHSIKLDRRTDVWSLGVTLYECLAGVRPFAAPSREGVYQNILGREPADLRAQNPAVPIDLAAVVSMALEKGVDRRYQSARELADDLARFTRDEAVLARPPGLARKVTRWAGRHPAIALASFVAATSLIVGLLVSLGFYFNARDALARRNETLDELTLALSHYEQMSDAKVLDELIEEDSRLWPRRAELVPAMRGWIAKAEALLERLPLHRAALAELASRAEPYDPRVDEELRRRASPELFESIASKVASVARLEAKEEEGRISEAEEERLDRLTDELAKLKKDPRFTKRLHWAFSDREDRWRHTVLQRLMERSHDLRTRLKHMRERLLFALKIRSETVERESVAWELCLRDLKGRPEFAGFGAAPLVGFVPLGKDADSQLWEFWHPGSGARPQWEVSTGDPTLGKVHIDDKSGLVMILVPGGAFMMGSSDRPGHPNFSRWTRAAWMPAHEVKLAPFLISKYEMTQAQWLRIMGGPNPSSYAAGQVVARVEIGLRNPVTDVNWFECQEATRRVGLRLPTEAQWEYACRAGSHTPWWTGAEAKSIGGFANLADRALAVANPNYPIEKWLDDGYAVHAPVGSFGANAFGLHDTIGNVWEWCRDRYQFRAYLLTPADPGNGLRRPSSEGRFRVQRGGSFRSSSTTAQSALRDKFAPDLKRFSAGFRPSMDLPQR